MATNTNATVDDLYQEPGKAELVNGELLKMSPAGFQHNRAAGAVYISLRQYEKEGGRSRHGRQRRILVRSASPAVVQPPMPRFTPASLPA